VCTRWPGTQEPFGRVTAASRARVLMQRRAMIAAPTVRERRINAVLSTAMVSGW